MDSNVKFEFKSQIDAVRDKDWAIGSKNKINDNVYILNPENKLTLAKVKYSPALMKIFDEILVNASDNFIKNPKKAKEIKVWFKNGEFIVWNDGPGIEIEIHEEASKKCGKQIYIPTFVFKELFQGSNGKREESIVGGTNGIGAKATNYCSNYFKVETADSKHLFEQLHENGSKITHEPTIKPSKLSFTRISFKPDYYLFESSSDDFALMDNLIRFRMTMLSTYLKNCKLFYNDVEIVIKNIEEIARLAYSDIMSTVAFDVTKNESKKETWEICFVMDDEDKRNISNINGIIVNDGEHFKFIKKQINDSVKQIIKTKIGATIKINNIKQKIENCFILFVNANIVNPKWDGQCKTSLKSSDINIKFNQKFLKEISMKIASKITGDLVEKKKPLKKITNERYIECPRAGSAKSSDAKLLLVEGLSALAQIQMGIATRKDREYFGILSTGGVTINVSKQLKDIELADDEVHSMKSTKLENNRFFTELRSILNLNEKFTYDKSLPSYTKEMKSLKYGAVIACVDQDVDGKGNILPLVLNMFATFWPKLLDQGYVKWFISAIARAYPKKGGNIINFYSIMDLNEWEKEMGEKKSNYEIKYYKGLATHDTEEVNDMFQNFNESVYTFNTDIDSKEYFDIFYGKDAKKRKTILRNPVPKPHENIKTFEDQRKTHIVYCTDLLKYEANEFHHDRLKRGLPHEIDGMNEAGRKIVDGIIKMFKSSNKEVKVAQAAGYISLNEFYHHGEKSLNDSIKNRGFITTGGVQLPIFKPRGFFGDRNSPVSGNERYINMRSLTNITDILFPSIDYQLLDFMFDGNNRAEPKYFVPIIPLGIVETITLPVSGWRVSTWARDVFDVIDYCKALILREENKSITLPNLRPCTYRKFEYEYKGRIEIINNKEYSMGEYNLHEINDVYIIVIKELPLKIWTNDYVNEIKKYTFVDKVEDKSALNINIHITISKDNFAFIKSKYGNANFDAIEDCFNLYNQMNKELNYFNKDDGVTEYEEYTQIIEEWFIVRKDLYKQRVTRYIILEELKCLFYKNIIRYIEENEKLNIAKQKSVRQIQILEEAKYDKFNKSKLLLPKFTKNADLVDKITQNKANFNYLLDLPDSQKSLEHLEKYKNNLENSMLFISTLKEDINGFKMWAKELDLLNIEIEKGAKTNWKFDDHDKYSFTNKK